MCWVVDEQKAQRSNGRLLWWKKKRSRVDLLLLWIRKKTNRRFVEGAGENQTSGRFVVALDEKDQRSSCCGCGRNKINGQFVVVGEQGTNGLLVVVGGEKNHRQIVVVVNGQAIVGYRVVPKVPAYCCSLRSILNRQFG